MDLTTDVWELAPDRATRVGHPAPFPVELPRKLIDLYTYEGDLVLDPFMGSGSTAVAAVRTGRHFVGFDTDAGYVTRALARVADERSALAATGDVVRTGGGQPVVTTSPSAVRVPAVAAAAGVGPAPSPDEVGPHGLVVALVDEATRAGRRAGDLARLVVEASGFTGLATGVKVVPGIDVTFRAVDRAGRAWYLDLHGAFSGGRPGLKRTEVLWRALGRASVVAAAEPSARLVLLTTDIPPPTSAGGRALAAVRGPGPGKTVVDVICLLDAGDLARLARYAEGGDPA
jgi:hypothetical protein